MYKKYILIILSFVFVFSACQLEDSSQAESGTNILDAKELLHAAIHQIGYNHSAIGGRTTATIMQYLKDNDANVIPNRFYQYAPDYFDHMWSSGYYAGSLATLNDIKTHSRNDDNSDLLAIALIMSAHEFQSLTSMFGDIPLREALNVQSTEKPIFDSQEEVYGSISDMLDEAIALIGSKTSSNELADNDLIYQGNLQNWKKFAYGLKARCLFNQRNKLQIDNEILDYINQSFENSQEQANFQFDANFTNPLFRFEDERPSTFSPGDHFVDQLAITNDPRSTKFIIFNNNNFDHFIDGTFISNWFNEDENMPLLSYTELQFMKADVAVHMNADQTEIGNLLSNAIASSMLDNDIVLEYDILDFIANASNLDGLDQEAMIEKITNQAYIAYYGNNHIQAWNNYRSTGYPFLTSTSTLFTENEYNPSNIVPRRFLYPELENLYNLDNVQEATNRQGGALLDDDLWMFK